MKLIITTVYENVDELWLQWWLEKMGPNYGIDSDLGKAALPHKYASKDPNSEIFGSTTIELSDGMLIKTNPEA